MTFTTLYPNAARPQHGIFVESRLRRLLETTSAQSVVVAPVPWFPFTGAHFGQYAAFAKAPREEFRREIRILHPRYALVPKIGMSLAPVLLFTAMIRTLRRIIEDGYDFDLIDAHYFYPDGVAAVMLGKYFNKPTVVTARGTDINILPKYQIPRRMIIWAAKHAAAIITVSSSLKRALTELGVAETKVTVLRNGVDLQLFRPLNRATVRAEMGLINPTLISVGNLVPLKGHDVVIRCLALLPDVELMILGAGPEENNLRKLARALEVSERVRFLPPVPQQLLPRYYSAADALVLASSREGWPNVLLEAMACGTRVIATNVGGNPEVVAERAAGIVVEQRSPEQIADAFRRLIAEPVDRRATRDYAERFDWDETSLGQMLLFERILGRA